MWRTIANPEQVFKLDPTCLLDTVGNAVMSAVTTGGLFMDVGTVVAVVSVGFADGDVVLRSGVLPLCSGQPRQTFAAAVFTGECLCTQVFLKK